MKIGIEAPGLVMDDTKLVDEEEVYRFFGGCLPVVLADRKYYFKTLRQLNAQRVGHANSKSNFLSSIIYIVLFLKGNKA